MAEESNKTYIWANHKVFASNSSHTGNNVDKKRGAPNKNGCDDVWGWSPGYYSNTVGVGNISKEGGDSSDCLVQYHLTLLGGNSFNNNDSSSNSEHTLTEATTKKLLESGDIVLANEWEKVPSDSPPSNLIELTHLHEPSVVNALGHRYEKSAVDMGNIYTDTGPILLAVNPFKRDESGLLYGEQTVAKYRTEGERRWAKERQGSESEPDGDLNALPPHVYAVADRTFRTMMTHLNPSTDASSSSKVNQSVLVSGESGAGKTVTTKLLMAYLSKLSEHLTDSSSQDKKESTMSIEKKILESSPIMESFGNARTIRNDNSSRFGKYIEMKFTSSSDTANGGGNEATLVGALIDTYLLEKVRLVHQSPGERNYHIFYELFSLKGLYAGSNNFDVDNQSQVQKMGLVDFSMEDFRLINTSGTYDRRDGVLDSETFKDLKRAMTTMGLSSKDISSVFEVTSALLHASNLAFVQVGEEGCTLDTDSPHLDHVVGLLGIDDVGELNSALCHVPLSMGSDGRNSHYMRKLTKAQAEKGLEALIKAIYGAMFNYLVKRINDSVAGDSGEKEVTSDPRNEASIGILDIFGFESFQVNSFEQLCINFCNETLQQQFNRFVLHNEQEEYDREGIPWSFIKFPENQDVLDLIDFKGSGILQTLADQCKFGGTDKKFAMALYGKCSKHGRFEANSRQVANQLFGIHHYAGLVEYHVEGFVEKNRDELPKSGCDLLQDSENDFVKTLAEIVQPAMLSHGSRSKTRPTVGIQFSSQLRNLRRKIDGTMPHYIRCLKPNDLLVPNHFDLSLIADQLRCAGVIEAVSVTRLGYPQRFSHSQFIDRFQALGRKLDEREDIKCNPAEALLHSIKQQMKDQFDVGIQVGRSKVFLRREAYDLLEKLRRERITSAVVIIQKNARTHLCKMFLLKALQSLLAIQCFVRKELAVKLVTQMRQHHSSIIIQCSWRKYAGKKLYASARFVALWCQMHQRGRISRKKLALSNRERKAQYLQSRWRGYMALSKFRQQIYAVLTIQCAKRCQAARLELGARKSEARDLSSVVQDRDKMKQEAIALRNELGNMRAEKTSEPAQQLSDVDGYGSTEKDTEISSLRMAWLQMLSEKEIADKELEMMKKSLMSLKSERDLAIEDRDELKQANKLLKVELNSREENARKYGGERTKKPKINPMDHSANITSKQEVALMGARKHPGKSEKEPDIIHSDQGIEVASTDASHDMLSLLRKWKF